MVIRKMKKIEIILSEENGILPNLQTSLERYTTCAPQHRTDWETEFNYWCGLMATQSRSVAEKYRDRFGEAVKRRG